MPEPAVPRLTRLLGIVTQLEEHGEASFDDLARHFGVSREVIKDDIDTLWVSGLPGYGTTDLLDFDGYAYEEGIARLVESLGIRQIRLAPAEAVALMGALGSIVASGVASTAAEGALDALRDAVKGAMAVTVVGASTTDQAAVQALREGIETSRAVVVTYIDARDRRTERVIEPHRLVALDGIGYVECFCRRAGDYRTLRLDRLEGAKETDEPQAAPRRASEGFALEPQYEAEVMIDLAGRWAFEDLPGVELEETPDGVVARFGVANPQVIVARLLAVGPHLKKVGPADLRAQLAEAAEAVLASASIPGKDKA
ncbi:MAG: WYL domain-containing protein [Demequinaceae bacterium]|nr:WYL domain-containing protein [Demequinaceae bacterium]